MIKNRGENMKKNKIFYVSIISFIVALIYIVLLKTVDVQSIGPKNSSVGFAHFNNWFLQTIGTNDTCYKITKYLGLLPFLLVGYYGFVGLKQLLNKKDINKVDKKLLLLGIFYILVGATYIFFEKVIINYRPVLMDGELEASFPSSHTMLAICVCASSLLISKYYIKNENIRKIIDILTWIVMIILVVGRALSGVHWITDIIGGILVSAFLISLFYSSINTVIKNK
jgi:undecaprenyl-diphosphatase